MNDQLLTLYKVVHWIMLKTPRRTPALAPPPPRVVSLLKKEARVAARGSRAKRMVGEARPGPKYFSGHVLYKWSLGLGSYDPAGCTGCILSLLHGNGA